MISLSYIINKIAKKQSNSRPAVGIDYVSISSFETKKNKKLFFIKASIRKTDWLEPFGVAINQEEIIFSIKRNYKCTANCLN
jgi:hypothetical protein